MNTEDPMDWLEEEVGLLEVLHGKRFEVQTIRHWLASSGYVPPPEPADVAKELERFLDALADIHVVVEFADHLSDPELYAFLIEELDVLTTVAPDSYLHTSPIGGCSEEDNQIYLSYYMTDEQRADWKQSFPDDELPPKKELPHHRHLYEEPRP